MTTHQDPINWGLHIALFFAALITTTIAGMAMTGTDPWLVETWMVPANLLDASLYAVPVMTILFAHEMGHYLHCRKYGVEATPPFFLPGIPLPGYAMMPFIGTFGAFIKMQVSPMRSGELLRIGAWGPIAGFIPTIPVLLIGIAISDIRPNPEDMNATMVLGDSLLLLMGETLFHPTIPEGHDVFLHPLGMAGWVGSFLTMLNLMPVGQLDGGHIAYSVFGEHYNRVVSLLFGAMLMLGVFWFMGWLVIAGLVYKIGIEHPPIMSSAPARGKDAWPAWASLGIFVVTFSPAPIEGASLIDVVTSLAPYFTSVN